MHVPKITYNLPSISEITRDLNCPVVFSPDNVFFQDLSSRKTIGTARHNRGLHLLDNDAPTRNWYRTSLLSSYFSMAKKDCTLWHFRLGHPNFQYMKYLFPHLFNKIDVSSLSCDVCIQNSIESPLCLNLINFFSPSPLFIVMFALQSSI